MPSPLQISLKVVGLDQAKNDLQQFAQGGKRSFEQLSAEAQELSANSAQTDRALSALANRVRALAAAHDPAAAASLRLRNSLVDVERALRAEMVTSQQAETLTAALRREHEALTRSASATVVASNDNSRAMVAGAANTNQMRSALTNLSFQFNDIATSLASGGSPFRVMAQQSGQVFQIWQQSPGVFGAAATAIRNVITPTTAVVAGMAALAVGFGVVLSRATDNAAQLRGFDAALRGLGPSSQITSTGLQKVAYDLRAIGVAAKDADAAVKAIARNPAINPANPLAVAQIAEIGTNVGSRLGIGTEAGITKTNEAIAAGAPAMIQLGLATRALNAEQAAALSLDVSRGKGLEALNKAIRLVSAALEDERAKVISASEAMKNTLGGAWDDMLNKLSETGPIKQTNENLTTFIRNLSWLFEKGEVPPDSRLGQWLKAMNQTAIPNTGPMPAPQGFRRLPDGRLAPTHDQPFDAPVVPGASTAPTFATGGALSAAAAGNANISGLNTTFASRLDAWLSALPEAERATISITSAFRDASRQAELFAQSDQSGRMVARPGGSAHNFGIAADIRGMSPTARAMLPLYGLQTPMSYEPWHVEPAETARANQATAAQRQASFMAFTSSQYGTGALAPRLPPPTAVAVDAAARSPAEIAEAEKALARQTEEIERQAKAYGLTGSALVEMQARIQATTQAQTLFNEEGDRAKFVEAAVADAVNKHNAELATAAAAQDKRTQGVIRSLDAFKISEAAGYRAIAVAEAGAEATERGGDAADIARRKLEEQAAAAVLAGQKQVAAAVPQVAAAERIAEATRQGTEAQRQAELQAQAAAKTQDALAKAEASRNPVLIAQAKALNDAALAEVTRADAARRTTAAFTAVNDNRRTLEVLQLQTGMVGADPAVVERATAQLAIQQRLATDFAGASEQARDAYRETATAIADARLRLVEASRETERWSDIFRSIASSIESSLTSAVERAFSGERITDWGQRIKSMLSSALSSLTANLFIRPALGSIAGGLGFGNVAQQFGSFGSIFGGSSAPVATLTPNSSGGFNISTLSSGASLVNNVSGGGIFGSGGSSGGLFGTGGITNFLNNDIGTSLGFWGGVPNAPGMFGTTTFTGFLGGAGAGLGAGMFLNSILGGDPLTGGIGSGVGSLAGAAIGSLFGGPMIGGLLGGALGSLFGLFGNQKPSNASAGGLLDLASGQITSGFAGGNQKIDQQTQQVVTSIAAITEALTAAGGTLQGNLLIQGGVNTGFTVDSTLPGFQGRFELGKDPMAAIQMIGLALTQSVEGASETVQTILAQTTDLNRLTENLAFAKIYDNIATAAEEAFANVEDATQRAGPFDLAMQQLSLTFDEIGRKTEQFNLDIEPVAAARAEATSRLQDDLRSAVGVSLNAATGLGAVNTINTAWDQYLASTREANAVGLTPEIDPAVHDQLGQIFTETVNAALAGMTPAQIDVAVIELDNLSDTVFPDLAAAAREVAAATAPALASLNALAEALTIGEVSGLTGAAAVQAQQTEFLSTQSQVQAGIATYDDLAAAGNALIQASIAAYGNGPQTEAMRQLILDTINPILAGSFASGTTSTPPGPILVGEKGPEIITQPGGLQVFNNADTMRILAAMPGRHFAEGAQSNVIPFPTMRATAAAQPRSGNPVAVGMREILSRPLIDVAGELRGLRRPIADLIAGMRDLGRRIIGLAPQDRRTAAAMASAATATSATGLRSPAALIAPLASMATRDAGRLFSGPAVPRLSATAGPRHADNATRIDRLLAAPQMRPLAPANDQGGSAQAVDVVAELRALRAENVALRASVTELLDRGNNIALRVGHEITLRQDRQIEADTAPAVIAPARRAV